ncbi:hypothetical protein [Flavilitoribacter nigricans]|uniref:Uncharacterized protein n=1 Tax=Flavilitoribacter nigricans (strain ATCC 23147 / DSM 23189 / NBRC 102662 / NCIMB 1420 / SS-2) TaxID=1122177 RepID=A0A2D0MXS6_FLAN2|nr:hypothetical protein [Flavilitoribacter nigricans]PHN00980.1 hypothetical protein CRP01_39560 [Flavilitoribacter nigricans DSM 23189 = NBRC 102662]
MSISIEEINSLISVISKNKVKQIEIIGNGEHSTSQVQQLYELLVNEEIKTDEEGREFFFDGAVNQILYFNRLKRKLRSRLYNTLFFIDVNRSTFNEIQRAYYTCYKESTAVKILIGRYARNSAISLAERTIKKAIKFDFTDITLELARTLRMHYSNIKGDKKKFAHYKKILKKYSEIYLAELKAEEYYSDLIINFAGSQSTKPELLDVVKKNCLELKEIIVKYNSYKLNLHSYMMFILRYEIENDFSNTLIVCNEAIKYFESKPHIISKTVVINFSLKKLVCFIMLKRFLEGENVAKYCLKLLPEGSVNWLISQNYYVILSFHSNQLQKAYSLYQEAKNHLDFDDKTIAYLEHWKVHEALINYLIAIKKVEINKNDDSTNFRLSKFINNVPTYSKDKQGVNISILIIQILFLLQNGKYEEIIDRTESLKTYVHRYLRRDHTFRSNCFIKMLLCLPAASFHKAGVTRKAKKYIDLLKSVPIEKANQSPEVEIIPYEMLWEFVLESLDNKFH